MARRGKLKQRNNTEKNCEDCEGTKTMSRPGKRKEKGSKKIKGT